MFVIKTKKIKLTRKENMTEFKKSSKTNNLNHSQEKGSSIIMYVAARKQMVDCLKGSEK